VLRVTDLKTVTVATADVEGAVGAFRQTFGFPVTRTTQSGSGQSLFLGIGAAEIEMTSSATDAGLHELVLEVEDLEQARATLTARGIATKLESGADGRPIARLGPKDTHGVRIALIGR
jgi:hypothetical protein